MRPLMATILRAAETRPDVGRYDEAAGLTIGSDGRPLAMVHVLGETETRVRQEPTDPTDPWMFETATAVRNEAGRRRTDVGLRDDDQGDG